MLAIILYSIFCLNRNFISRRGAKLLRGNPHPTHMGTVTGALNYQQPISNFSLFAVICWLNPRTYAQSYPHRGTMGREGGGGWGCWTLLPLFRFCLQWESLRPSLQHEVYFMRGGDAGGLWRHQTWLPSCIFSRTGNQEKTVQLILFGP